jgi:hypothetical protein
VAKALIKGKCNLGTKTACEKCAAAGTCEYDSCYKSSNLKAQSKVEAITKADLTYNEGYCSGSGYGGNVLDVWLGAVRPRYLLCHVFCFK